MTPLVTSPVGGRLVAGHPAGGEAGRGGGVLQPVD